VAQILRTDGTKLAAEPKNGVQFTLGEAQAIVGGYVEALRTVDGFVLILNEEGLLLGLAHNQTASQLVGGYIVGDVLLCRDSEFP